MVFDNRLLLALHLRRSALLGAHGPRSHVGPVGLARPVQPDDVIAAARDARCAGRSCEADKLLLRWLAVCGEPYSAFRRRALVCDVCEAGAGRGVPILRLLRRAFLGIVTKP